MPAIISFARLRASWHPCSVWRRASQVSSSLGGLRQCACAASHTASQLERCSAVNQVKWASLQDAPATTFAPTWLQTRPRKGAECVNQSQSHCLWRRRPAESIHGAPPERKWASVYGGLSHSALVRLAVCSWDSGVASLMNTIGCHTNRTTAHTHNSNTAQEQIGRRASTSRQPAPN